MPRERATLGLWRQIPFGVDLERDLIACTAHQAAEDRPEMKRYGRRIVYAVCIAIAVMLLVYFDDRLWALWVWLWT